MRQMHGTRAIENVKAILTGVKRDCFNAAILRGDGQLPEPVWTF